MTKIAIIARVDGRSHPDAGDTVTTTPTHERVHLF